MFSPDDSLTLLDWYEGCIEEDRAVSSTDDVMVEYDERTDVAYTRSWGTGDITYREIDALGLGPDGENL